MPFRFAAGSMLLALVVTGCSVATPPGDATGPETTGTARQAVRPDSDFEVALGGCDEMASLAPIPLEPVRSEVPASYALVGESDGYAVLVVRIGRCAHSVIDGVDDGPSILAQVGPNIESPDGSGDINNYSLFTYTTSKALALKLKAAGVNAQHVPTIDFAVTAQGATGQLAIDVPAPANPRFHVEGSVVLPSGPPVPFSANWWRTRGRTETKQNTVLEAIQFSTADLSLQTDEHGKLGRILGASTTTFPFFDSYNAFASGRFIVTTTP